MTHFAWTPVDTGGPLCEKRADSMSFYSNVVLVAVKTVFPLSCGLRALLDLFLQVSVYIVCKLFICPKLSTTIFCCIVICDFFFP